MEGSKMNDKDIIRKVLDNTEIKRNTTRVQEINEELESELDEVAEKEEKRKEQLREAQKKFKKIGCSCKV